MSVGKAIPINPYLADIIKTMKAAVPEETLRKEYEKLSREAVGEGRALPWLEFLGERALRRAVEENPLLKMRRREISLPKEILDGLYWLRVDVLADLLQITKEELKRFERQERLDVGLIEQYLCSLGLRLYEGAEECWKIPALRIIDPGKARHWQAWDFTSFVGHKVELARPTLVEDWFNEYYLRYECCPDEEKLSREWLDIRPMLDDDDSLPSDIEEFFRDTRYFFDEYRVVCDKHGILVEVGTPAVPDSPDELKYFSNDRYISIKKDVVKAVLSVMENSDVLGMPTRHFLRAGDERKLSILEEIKEDEALQLMFIEYVGLRVDMENLVYYFRELSGGGPERKKNPPQRPDPINPWLAELILKYRAAYSDDIIRAAYKTFSEQVPGKSWENFLAERAMVLESRSNPFILTGLEDCDLLDVTKQFLSTRCSVENVADLVQITEEEYMELFVGHLWEISYIDDLLKKYGLHLYHSDRSTYKLPFPKD